MQDWRFLSKLNFDTIRPYKIYLDNVVINVFKFYIIFGSK